MRLRAQGYGATRIGRKLGIPIRTVDNWIHLGKKPLSAWTEEEKHVRYEKVSGENHPFWKGNNVGNKGARHRARKMYPGKGDRHHKDGIPQHNERENVDILTRREHMIKDGRLAKLIARNRAQSGPNHPQWKGDEASEHAKYMRKYRRG